MRFNYLLAAQLAGVSAGGAGAEQSIAKIAMTAKDRRKLKTKTFETQRKGGSGGDTEKSKIMNRKGHEGTQRKKPYR
jgi:hypothetical protein